MVDPGNYTKPTTIKTKPPQEGLADYFVFFLERDVLGKVCNLHLALADQFGPLGPMSEECLTLAHMQSVAVDFAKHGESIDGNLLEQYDRLVVEWPDFFEKNNKEMRISEGILGQMYRDINNEVPMANLIQFDYEKSIKRQYNLDARILG